MKKVERKPQKRESGKNVLIVDDNAAVRKMLADAFLSDGFKTCSEAGNGSEGVEIAKQLKPDLIILDLAMPVMNGLQAAPVLRKLFPRTRIILFTLYAASLLEAEASKAGVNLVLQKTDSLSTLIKKAHELMGD